MPSSPRTSRLETLAEIALIFAVFFVQAAWPVPDVNEGHYVGKAIHFWNPDWLRGDFFLESADAHWTFEVAFGWLSLWMPRVAVVWTGRILIWLLLAWAWQRLSRAAVPKVWCSVLTAALFACLLDRCHMAGEWVLGGVEAKGFAYVLLLLGLESLVRDRWNRALALFGAAAAFHVLVGGWAAVAAGLVWAWLRARCSRLRDRASAACGFAGPPLRTLWPGIIGGLLLALPGLIPSLSLDWGVPAEIARRAHEIYVYDRLPHHLVLIGMEPWLIARMILLVAFWFWLGRRWGDQRPTAIAVLRSFVLGAISIAAVGVVLQVLIFIAPGLAADVLRYYWFRLADVAVPLGVALESTALLTTLPRRRWQRAGLALAIILAAFHLSDRAFDRIMPAAPRSHRVADPEMTPEQRLADYHDWLAACNWIANSGKIPADARFLTPIGSQTFKWYADRSEVAVWKDLPQDARSVLAWRDRIKDIYATGVPTDDARSIAAWWKRLKAAVAGAPPPTESPWYDRLGDMGAMRLAALGEKYGADYAIAQRSDPTLDLPIVFQSASYVIYKLPTTERGNKK